MEGGFGGEESENVYGVFGTYGGQGTWVEVGNWSRLIVGLNAQQRRERAGCVVGGGSLVSFWCLVSRRARTVEHIWPSAADHE